MNRRQFLHSVGVGTVGLSVSNVSSECCSDTSTQLSQGHLPHQDVPHEVVTPYADHAIGNPPIFDDKWIIHRFGWRTVPKEGPETLQQFREEVTYDFAIDGVEVEETAPYWSEIQPADDENHYHVRWEYATPPKPPGTYQFRVRMNFDSPIQSLDGTGNTQTREGEITERSTYNVFRQEAATPSLPAARGIHKRVLAEQNTDQNQEQQSLDCGEQKSDDGI